MLDVFIVSCRFESVFKIINGLFREWIWVNQTISVVSSCCLKRLWSVISTSIYIRSKYFFRLGLISHMYDSNRTCGTESAPVDGFSNPIKIFSQEHIVSGQSIHDTVCKDNSSVSNRVLFSNLSLKFLQENHISMVILVQKLMLVLSTNFVFENFWKFINFLVVLTFQILI